MSRRLDRQPIPNENDMSAALDLAKLTPVPDHNITQYVHCNGSGRPLKDISLSETPIRGRVMHRGMYVATNRPLITGTCGEYVCGSGWVSPTSTTQINWRKVTI